MSDPTSEVVDGASVAPVVQACEATARTLGLPALTDEQRTVLARHLRNAYFPGVEQVDHRKRCVDGCAWAKQTALRRPWWAPWRLVPAGTFWECRRCGWSRRDPSAAEGALP